MTSTGIFLFGLVSGITLCIVGFGFFCLHVYTKDSKNKLGEAKK